MSLLKSYIQHNANTTNGMKLIYLTTFVVKSSRFISLKFVYF